MLDYRNRHLHGLLDRLLGLQVVEVMSGATTMVLESPEWHELAKRLMADFGKFFPDARALQVGELPGLAVDDDIYVAVHPLRRAGTGPLADGQVAGQRILSVDTFNLSRRMAWCRANEQRFIEERTSRTAGLHSTGAASQFTSIDCLAEDYGVSTSYVIELDGKRGRARIQRRADGLVILPGYDFGLLSEFTVRNGEDWSFIKGRIANHTNEGG
jgi:hypothetical protein